MALNGVNSISFYSGGYSLILEWTGSQSVSNNTTDITAIMYLQSNGRGYGMSSTASKSGRIIIDGYNHDFTFNATLAGNQKKKIHEATRTIYHDSSGKKSITMGGFAGINLQLSGGYIGQVTLSNKRFTLDTIPRESRITSYTITDIRPTQFKINYSVDKPINRTRYRLDSGSWSTLPSSGIIGGLDPNRQYRVQIEVRNSSSGLTSTSSNKSVRTMELSTIKSPKRIETGKNFDFDWDRPSTSLMHDITFQVFKESTEEWIDIATEKDRASSVYFTPTSTEWNKVYNARPNDKEFSARFKVVYKWSDGQVQGTRYFRGEKAVKVVNANPSMGIVSYLDTNSTTQGILNNNQKILRNKSDLRILLSSAGSQKGASLKHITVSIGGKQTRVNLSGTSQLSININVGKIDQASNQTAIATVTDSRGFTASRSFTVDILDYREPQFTTASADRLNLYEESSTLNIVGRRTIVKPGSSDVNSINYRYRIKQNPSGSFGSWVNLSSSNDGTNGIYQKSRVSQYMGDYPSNNSYTIEIGIKDKFTSWSTITIALSEGIALMRFMKDAVEIGNNLHIPDKHGTYILFKRDGDVAIAAGSPQDMYTDGANFQVFHDGRIRGTEYQVRDNDGTVRKFSKADVGLGNVPNFNRASYESARAGMDNDRIMTPQRTKEALETLSVEKGSNSNGEWWKYPDGTMICTRTVIATGLDTVHMKSDIFRIRLQNYSFPQNFMNVYHMSAGLAGGDPAALRNGAWFGGFGYGYLAAPHLTTKWNSPTIFVYEAIRDGSIALSLFAIGRWK